jgi:hypothetical protein
MPIGPPEVLEDETTYNIHVSVDDVPGMVFTVSLAVMPGVTGAQKDQLAQRLVNLFEGHPALTVTSAEKRVAATRIITAE